MLAAHTSVPRDNRNTHCPDTFFHSLKEKDCMNKQELVDKIAADTNTTKAAAGAALGATLEAISAAIANGDSVQLVGFGTFATGKRAARVGRNPQTGAEIKIAEATTVKFTAGKSLKELVNAPKSKK